MFILLSHRGVLATPRQNLGEMERTPCTNHIGTSVSAHRVGFENVAGVALSNSWPRQQSKLSFDGLSLEKEWWPQQSRCQGRETTLLSARFRRAELLQRQPSAMAWLPPRLRHVVVCNVLGVCRMGTVAGRRSEALRVTQRKVNKRGDERCTTPAW